MKRATLQLAILICVSLLFLVNCEDITDEREVSPEDSTAAVALVADANASLLTLVGGLLVANPDSGQTILNDLDLSEPYDFYAKAHELDWRNQDANFGIGFTSLLILSQNAQLDDIFGSQAKVFEPFRSTNDPVNTVGYAFGLPLTSDRMKGMMATYFELPLSSAHINFEYIDTFNAFQAEVINSYIPMIDVSLEALDTLDNDIDYLFPLGASIQLDIADINAIESSLLALQGLFKGLAAYNFDMDTQTAAGITAGLSTGSTFSSLNSNGASLLAEAHASALAAIERATDAVGLLEAETTPGIHSFVQFDRGNLAQVRAGLVSLTDLITTPATVEYGFSDERGEMSVDGSATMDLSQYYLNPVSDLKTLLPSYTVGTTTAYNYSQATLNEQINFEETEVVVAGLSNTAISIDIQYSESNSDTTATVTLGFLSFNLLTANQNDLPEAIWELWAEFLLTIGDYSDELYNYPEISFQWSGFITTGTSLTIDGNISIDYLERTTSYTAPDILWAAGNYGEWIAGWTDPTANGMFPNFIAEDLAALLGISWE